ncbi:MAG: glycoside hydrolase family 5 protein [Treponema sp.]|jgi:endoglucanase|nr:glycoside hydrolase family 5 protein [Treponema sp.]
MRSFRLVPVLLLFVLLSACQTTDKPTTEKLPVAAFDPAAAEQCLAFVRGMEIGINIGNTLDSITNDMFPQGETSWGNPRISRAYIRALKNYGYKTIRLPVTWAEYIGSGPNYIIEEERMKRVEQVVGWILAEEMYCILNLHHDGGGASKSWIRKVSADRAGTLDRFAKVWHQIAVRFADASDYLIFESMNEVETTYSALNALNQTFVDTVRKTEGNNKTRYLLVAGYNTDINDTCNFQFKMPDDTVAGRLILSIHYYTPPQFCIAEQPNNSWGFRSDWGTSATEASDNAELARQIGKLKSYYIDKGIPIILGEYGVTISNKVEGGRTRWITAVTKICLENGICPVLWETGLGTGGDIQRTTPFTMSDALKAVWQELKP